MKNFRLLSGLVLLALIFGGVTSALAHGGEVNLIHACVRNTGGLIRIIPATGACKPWEHALDWGIIGPPGPQGQQGDAGQQGEPGPKGDKGDTGDSALANLTCSTDQIIRWNGSAWVCSDDIDNDTLASLNCTVNQTIGWNGSAWVCRSAPIVATLSRTAFSPPCCSIPDMFQAYSPNVDTVYGPCDGFMCDIHLVDVLDHTSCQVNFTGNSQQNIIQVFVFTDRITLQFIDFLDPSEPFYVNISCAT